MLEFVAPSWNSGSCKRSDIGIIGREIAGHAILNKSMHVGLTGILLAALMTGCGSNVVLEAPTIPVPLINQIPASVGLRMPAEFNHFVHEEEIIGREEWSIDLSNSNAALFEQLFGYMFEKVTILGPEEDPQQFPIDVLIEPSIDAFEFSVPNQSKTESFAVWIRYRIKVYDEKGDEVANWPVSAYGKSQKASMSGTQALQRAAILAMRDAAALMIMKLDEATGISRIIAARDAVNEAPVEEVADVEDAENASE
jgi:hypothetical protein